MDKVTRLLAAATFALIALLTPSIARAQDDKEQTALRVGGPEQVYAGDRVVVQAVLADSEGKAVPGATIYFVTSASFLSGSGEMILAQGVTNQNGQAVAEFQNHDAGPLVVQGLFRGDDRYAASKAETEIDVQGTQQVYLEHAGVQIPGLNEPPPVPVYSSIGRSFPFAAPDVQDLWPSLSGWPVALALAAVWSLYAFAIVLIFRIAAASPDKRGGYNPQTGRFE